MAGLETQAERSALWGSQQWQDDSPAFSSNAAIPDSSSLSNVQELGLKQSCCVIKLEMTGYI